MVCCVFKLLSTKNRVRHIRINTRLDLEYFLISLKIRFYWD